LISKARAFCVRLASALMVGAVMFAFTPHAFAGNELKGLWTLRITIPESPTSATSRTFTVTMDVSPRGDSLHGRANITDQEGKTIGVAWRQVGKSISIAYELPCPGDGPCASLILLGRVKGGGMLIKKGSVIVMWDTPNDRNPALYDTSNGSFRGDRLQ
jgi:hypothetical protein